MLWCMAVEVPLASMHATTTTLHAVVHGSRGSFSVSTCHYHYPACCGAWRSRFFQRQYMPLPLPCILWRMALLWCMALEVPSASIHATTTTLHAVVHGGRGSFSVDMPLPLPCILWCMAFEVPLASNIWSYHCPACCAAWRFCGAWRSRFLQRQHMPST